MSKAVRVGPADFAAQAVMTVSDGATEFDYFCFQPGDPVNVPADSGFGAQLTNLQPLFPLFASTGDRPRPH